MTKLEELRKGILKGLAGNGLLLNEKDADIILLYLKDEGVLNPDIEVS